MKTLFVTTAAFLMLSAAPALAMSCCGGGKGAMLCGKGAMMCGKGAMLCGKGGGMPMNHAKRKGGCCCEGMNGATMSKRT